jgi:putative DNA primase/helicase
MENDVEANGANLGPGEARVEIGKKIKVIGGGSQTGFEGGATGARLDACPVGPEGRGDFGRKSVEQAYAGARDCKQRRDGETEIRGRKLAGGGQGVGMIRLDGRRARRVEWLWEGRVPLGKVTLLVGDPDVGKSFVALDLAARVSRGEGVGGERGLGKPGNVLLLSADDDVDDTIVPRLTACGADLSRVAVLPSLVERDEEEDPENGEGEGARLLSLVKDRERLRRAARELGECRLIVLDPVTAYLQGLDGNNNVGVRGVLLGLAELARETGAAVLLVSHHRKSGVSNVLHRAIGSLAFTAVARVVLTVLPDPGVQGRRLLLPVKETLRPCETGRSFRIVEGRLEWDEEGVPFTADDLQQLAGSGLVVQDRTRETAEWLTELLKEGRKPSEEVQRLAAEREVPRNLLWRAKAQAKVKAVRDGREERWFWELPVDPAQSEWWGDLWNPAAAVDPSWLMLPGVGRVKSEG